MFGSLTTLIIIPIMHLWLGRRPENHGGYFDAITGIHQILDNSIILYTSFAIAISIAIFNFCGLGVTRSSVFRNDSTEFILIDDEVGFPRRLVRRSIPVGQ